MTETLAIDFGTSRTKVAYWHAQRGCAELLRLERDEPYLLSACYVLATREGSQGGGYIWGAAAERMLERHPYAVVQALKRDLQEITVKAGRRRIPPQELLTHLFADLRQRAGKAAVLAGKAPQRAVLTAPAGYGLTEERLLKDAARAAGFAEVELISEPVAAARAWLAETGETVREVVVLDCGGGTLDWAYLRQQGESLQVVSECPPGSDRRVGGVDVDEALLALIEAQLDEAAYEELEARRPYYLARVRLLKEDYCQDLPLEPLLIGEQLVHLDAEAIQGVLEERFIRQACEGLQGYLRQVRAVNGGESPSVLLVGGSARLKGLKEALEETCEVQVLDWERSAFATVLGAAVGMVEPSELPEKVCENNKSLVEIPETIYDDNKRLVKTITQTNRENVIPVSVNPISTERVANTLVEQASQKPDNFSYMPVKRYHEPSAGVIALSVISSILLPPLGVAIKLGFNVKHILISIVLTLMGYWPGIIHALWVSFAVNKE